MTHQHAPAVVSPAGRLTLSQIRDWDRRNDGAPYPADRVHPATRSHLFGRGLIEATPDGLLLTGDGLRYLVGLDLEQTP